MKPLFLTFSSDRIQCWHSRDLLADRSDAQDDSQTSIDDCIQATQDVKQSVEDGIKIVRGVELGANDELLGLPVSPTLLAVSNALDTMTEDASGCYRHHLGSKKPQIGAEAFYVAASFATAEFEDAEIPLTVVITEHIPLHDMLRVGRACTKNKWLLPQDFLGMSKRIIQVQFIPRLFGPDSPEIMPAPGKLRIGFHPLPILAPSCVGKGIKRRTLSYENLASKTRAGHCQDLGNAIGGDFLPGTDSVDALRIFENDQATKGVIIAGVIEAHAEENAGDWIQKYHSRYKDPKYASSH